MPLVIMAAVLISLLLILHELGHFIMARAGGIGIVEFGVGFGPEVIQHKVGQTNYVLRAIPFGAYVRPVGMDPNEPAPGKSSYFSKTVGQRALFVLGGPAVNIALAVVLFSVALAVFGGLKPTLTVAQVLPGYPAEKAGVKPGDVLVSVDQTQLRDWNELTSYVRARPHKALGLTVRRGDRLIHFNLAVGVDQASGSGVIGVSPEFVRISFGLPAALKEGIRQSWSVISALIRGLLLMIARKVKPDLIGPVGIGQIVVEATRAGAESLIYTIGAISMSLGFTNLLPIPGLDGSRLLFLAVEWIMGRPIDPKKENAVHLVGLIGLLFLGAIIFVRDIQRLGMR
ncbi:MAG TPA: site-2 protease family protein [Firmicutes bacterium]|nr:site-2 protease family protein [Bacillota bacterium]